ncbi:hypothetical protein [Halorubrum salsamenti]|uniref:hypothetical protein n=1 Tax=Halorubrum salsamenti TaxID=2583990 RepID=UPI0011A7474A|nr:hypothetical protein [Halorubrum salsamenti]
MSEEGDGDGDGEEGEGGESDEPADPLDAAGIDPVVPESAADAAGEAFAEDDAVRAFLREIAADVRGDSSESKQLSAILYRVSDLYDSEEQTSPEEIYLNVRHIMRIKEQGGIER